MTIEKGKEWGEEVLIQQPPPVIDTDAGLARVAKHSIVSLSRGNVFDALGHPRPVVAGETRQRVSIDALICNIEIQNSPPTRVLAASDIVIGKYVEVFHQQSEHLVITNAGMMRGRNFAPRSHPNDGKFDVVMFAREMSVRQRLQARSRLKTGTHLPHPYIKVSQATQFQYERLSRNQTLRIDGIAIPDWVSISIAIEPDFWGVIV